MVESQEGEAKGNIEIFEFFLADAMKREYIEHYSNSLGKQMHMCIYGHAGVPLLGFPTQDSNCHNYEDFGIIYHLSDFIEQGRSNSDSGSEVKKAGHVKMVFLRGGQQDRSSTIIILLKKCIRF